MKAITNIGQLLPDDRNANKGTERGNAFIERSLREYGAGRSIVPLENLETSERTGVILLSFLS
jgi:hypothetical protein